ncbi:MAG: T9SS type A sorting domain-containing protein, partial [Ignavibacteria bacterium]|nr:T9SS type A sorting domain-containing protein [Ignavibacteria bacterium]
LAKYAHLYGNIYSIRSNIDKYYAAKNIDSVLFRAEFSNRFNHPFTPNIIYSNLDSTLIDSTTIFDDGLHGDLLSNDGIYGGYIPPISVEDFYSISTSTIDHQNNKYFLTPNNTGFTTSGPVVIDSIMFAHLPAQKRYSIKPFLLNLSTSISITNATIKIICNDTWLTNYTTGILYFPTLQPGIRTISNSICALYYDSTFPGYFNLKFEIYKNGFCYWKDSIRFTPSPVGVEEELNAVPSEFALSQNYPNPFNSLSVIKYSIPKSSQVTLKIFNTLGEEIETLINEEKPIGTYEVSWNVANLPSGVYFYRIQAGSFIQTRKMILLK